VTDQTKEDAMRDARGTMREMKNMSICYILVRKSEGKRLTGKTRNRLWVHGLDISDWGYSSVSNFV